MFCLSEASAAEAGCLQEAAGEFEGFVQEDRPAAHQPDWQGHDQGGDKGHL